jgi:hypothetical protein
MGLDIAYAKRFVLPTLIGYEFGMLNFGLLFGLFLCACGIFNAEPLWKIVIGFLLTLCTLPILAVAVAFAFY